MESSSHFIKGHHAKLTSNIKKHQNNKCKSKIEEKAGRPVRLEGQYGLKLPHPDKNIFRKSNHGTKE